MPAAVRADTVPSGVAPVQGNAPAAYGAPNAAPVPKKSGVSVAVIALAAVLVLAVLGVGAFLFVEPLLTGSDSFDDQTVERIESENTDAEDADDADNADDGAGEETAEGADGEDESAATSNDSADTASATEGTPSEEHYTTDGNPTVASEYILPDSDSRYYSREELEALSAWELKIAHNEIHARHGKGFRSQELQNYFDGCSWYHKLYSADEYDANPPRLNQYEDANDNLMTEIRKERGEL